MKKISHHYSDILQAMMHVLFVNVPSFLIGTTSSSTQQQERQPLNNSTTTDSTISSLTVHPIGRVRSIYKLCVGTPRQGLLAPMARGRIELNSVQNARDMVDGLEGYSHIWVVFWFHLNTSSNSGATSSSPHRSSTNNSNNNRPSPAKIAPPALGGQKVGVLATRSPHRNNPIGITLCKLDSIITTGGGGTANKLWSPKPKGRLKSKNQNNQLVVLNISGLDLVDGTPVLDIKPYVAHYDSIPDTGQLRLPPWVNDGLQTHRRVQIAETAQQQLLQGLEEDPYALEFYGPHCGDGCTLETATRVWECVQQVLAMDVRSAWQTQKARMGQSHAERAQRIQRTWVSVSNTNNKNYYNSSNSHSSYASVSSVETSDTNSYCTQQIDNLLIRYTVDSPNETLCEASQGSGAEDTVTVHSIQWLVPRDTSSSVASSGSQNFFEGYHSETNHRKA